MTIDIQPIDPVEPRRSSRATCRASTSRRPLSPDEVAAVHAGMDRFGVLVFHDQKIDDDQQLVFSRSLGPARAGDRRHRQRPRTGGVSMDLNDISNLDKNNKVLARDDRRRLFGLGNQLWHSDSSFKPVPAKYSLLSARHIPPTGGNTEFADMRAAYDALDDETKARGARPGLPAQPDLFARHPGLHRLHRRRAREVGAGAPAPGAPPSARPAGCRSISPAMPARIEGWPVPEARAFLRDLTEHATQRKFVYAHVWRPHDLVMWDNRVTMHRARRYDHAEVRDMRRTTLTNEVSSLEQAP